MNPDFSPFTPRRLASANVFTGRKEYIDDLLVAVRKAKRGELSVAWVGGERGIGKSSLVSFAGRVAEQQESALFAHVHLGSATTVKGIAQKAYLSLLDDSRDKSWGKKLLSLFGERVRTIGLYGLQIELDMKPGELPTSLAGIADELAGMAGKSGRDVAVLAMDDINGIAEKPAFAHAVKEMVDGLAGRRHIPVCMFLVGLEERLDAMRKNNPSVVRCFQPMIHVEPWALKESEKFFGATFKSGGATVGKDDLEFFARLCGGMPTIAHEIGDAVWSMATEENISNDDAMLGVTMAIDSIGKRFLQPEIIDALQSNIYRSILGKIAVKPWAEFARKELLAPGFLTGAEKKGLDAFLKRMSSLGGIIPVQDKRAVYRFPSHIHEIYFAWNVTKPRNGKK